MVGDKQNQPEKQQKEKGSSLLVSGGLMLLSAFVFISSFFIPAPEGWQTAPGMLPMLLGGSLFVMATAISWEAINNGAWISLKESFKGNHQSDPNTPLWRVVVAICVVGVFYFVLLQFLLFEFAAFLFLLTMLQIYWAESKFWHRLLVSLLMPFIITLSFNGIFGIPMPGDSNVVQELIFWWKQKGN